jgi:hypothetical protein
LPNYTYRAAHATVVFFYTPTIQILESVKIAQTVGNVASAVGGPAIAAQANRADLTLLLLVCSVDFSQPSVFQNPLGFRIGTSALQYEYGTVVGNSVLLLGLAATQLLGIAVYGVAKGAPCLVAAAMLRFPSLLVILVMLLQQPTVAAVVTCARYGDTGYFWLPLLGGIVWLAPIFLSWYVVHPSQFRCRYVYEPRFTCYDRVMLGGGTWVDLDAASHYKQRCQFYFADCSETTRWFVVAEMVMNVFCAVVQGLIFPGECVSLLIALTAGFFVFVVVLVRRHPYAVPAQFLVSLGSAMLQCTSNAAALISAELGSNTALLTSQFTNLACNYLLLLAVLLTFLPRVRKLRKLCSTLRRQAQRGDGHSLKLIYSLYLEEMQQLRAAEESAGEKQLGLMSDSCSWSTASSQPTWREPPTAAVAVLDTYDDVVEKLTARNVEADICTEATHNSTPQPSPPNVSFSSDTVLELML